MYQYMKFKHVVKGSGSTFFTIYKNKIAWFSCILWIYVHLCSTMTLDNWQPYIMQHLGMLGNPRNNKTKVVHNTILCLSKDFSEICLKDLLGVLRRVETGRLNFCLYLNDLQCIHRIFNIHLQTYETQFIYCLILATLQDNIY